jgi:argininosuccinate lyase
MTKDIYSYLTADDSVKNKKSSGSTSPDEVVKQIKRLRKIVDSKQ